MLHLSRISGASVTADDVGKIFAAGGKIKVSGPQAQREGGNLRG
jgi:hypothetical protein